MSSRSREMRAPTSSGPDLDMESRDAKLLASRRCILSRQHGCVRRRLVAIGLDLHSTRYPTNGFTAADRRQVELA